MKFNKTMIWTILVTLIVLAIINNVSGLSQLKKQINGDTGWF